MVDESYVEKAEQWRRSLGGTQRTVHRLKSRVSELEEENERLKDLVEGLLGDGIEPSC